MSTSATSKEYRASNGIFFRIEDEDGPLLLLRGLMVSGAMYDPLIELPRDRFRMLVTDLVAMGRAATSMVLTMWRRSPCRAYLV
jgi:hypothetical protein